MLLLNRKKRQVDNLSHLHASVTTDGLPSAADEFAAESSHEGEEALRDNVVVQTDAPHQCEVPAQLNSMPEAAEVQTAVQASEMNPPGPALGAGEGSAADTTHGKTEEFDSRVRI